MDAAEASLSDHGVEGVQSVAPSLGGIVPLLLRSVDGLPAVGAPACISGDGDVISEIKSSRTPGGEVSVAPLNTAVKSVRVGSGRCQKRGTKRSSIGWASVFGLNWNGWV